MVPVVYNNDWVMMVVLQVLHVLKTINSFTKQHNDDDKMMVVLQIPRGLKTINSSTKQHNNDGEMIEASSESEMNDNDVDEATANERFNMLVKKGRMELTKKRQCVSDFMFYFLVCILNIILSAGTVKYL